MKSLTPLTFHKLLFLAFDNQINLFIVMKNISLLFVVVFSLVFASSCHAQALYTQSKKAKKYYDNAITFYQAKEYELARRDLNKAIEKDNNFINAYLLLADIEKVYNQPRKAIKLYKKTLEINPDFRPHTYYQLAGTYRDILQFDTARAYYQSYLRSGKVNPKLEGKVRYLIDQCEVADKLVKNPVPFNPINMGKMINSASDEYANAVTTERDQILFTVKAKVDYRKREVEDFYFSNRDTSNAWQERQKLSGPINSRFDDGALVISPDGQLAIFASNRPGGKGRYDLYYTRKKGGKWSIPQNMGDGVNTEYWESQPSISSDGKTVYFVSDRRGGYGGSDIYFVTLQADGSFGNPYNLGAPVNTKGNEMTPFIHQDARTMYFVSNGHLGMGESDIFVARKDNKGVFSIIENIGYPINSTQNELGLIVDATGQLAYYSSDALRGLGGFDIYAFEMPESAKPNPVTYLKGIAFDKETKQKLEVQFELIDLQSGATWISSVSDAITGAFLVCVPLGKELGLNAYRDGYLFYSDHFNVDVISGIDKPFLKDVPMTPVKKGEKIVLKNILFATASFELRPESKVELAKLKALLDKNPSLHIEISGHTDNVGSAQQNQKLSENRAKAVYEYLIAEGIGKDRLSFVGYGQTQPIADNDTEEGRQENRRTEMKVLSI